MQSKYSTESDRRKALHLFRTGAKFQKMQITDFSARKRYGKSIDLILSQEKYIHFCQCNSLCHEKMLELYGFREI